MIRYVIGISIVSLTLIVIRSVAQKRISRRLQYALWLLIPIYMAVYPFFSIGVTLPEMPVYHTVQENPNDSGIPVMSDAEPVPLGGYDAADTVTPPARTINWPKTAENISWFVTGILIALIAVYNFIFALWSKRRRSFIETDPISGLRVYRTDIRTAPYLLGKGIYLNDSISDGTKKKYAICHEYCHYKHGDPLWMALRLVVIAINWYNPLVLCACALALRDCETACDEAVLDLVGEERNVEYGKVLLSLASDSVSEKHVPGIMATMKGRSRKIMKERIENIKTPIINTKQAVISVISIALIATGCSLIEFNEPEGSVVSEPVVTETSEIPVESQDVPEVTEDTSTVVYSWRLPDVGELSDGMYTVSMSPIGVYEEGYGDTQVFFPWTQIEMDQDAVDGIEVGSVIDIPEGYSEENAITVDSIDAVQIEPNIRYGTHYTGEIIYLNDNDGFSIRKTEEGTWKMFCWDSPVYIGNEPMRLPVADNVRLYDAYHPVVDEETVGLSNEELKALVEFTDTTLTEGRLESISDFFDSEIMVPVTDVENYDISSSTVMNHTYTVIEVTDNEITAVYFCYCS